LPSRAEELDICTITTLKAIGSDAALGECTIGDTALPTGAAALTADYRGDGNYQSSISAAQTAHNHVVVVAIVVVDRAEAKARHC